METIGERIRSERHAQDIERADLAKDVGLSYTALSDLEHGRTHSTPKLHRIAERLGLRVKWLETEKGPKYADSGTTLQEGTLREVPPSVAELWIVLDLTARALAASTPDGGRRLVAALEGLPKAVQDRPVPQKLIKGLKAEIEQQALLHAATRKTPKQS